MAANLGHLKEELRNITTLNLIANTSSILEKIFWALIAIFGTLFIYDVVYIQLDYWQENPSLVTKEILPLSHLPLPSITFCHKGFQKYGPVETLANFIDPDKKVPKEVLSIRNEFLKVQFLEIKQRPNRTNYCEWLFNLKYGQKNKHPALSSLGDESRGGVDRKNILEKCLVRTLVGKSRKFRLSLVKINSFLLQEFWPED